MRPKIIFFGSDKYSVFVLNQFSSDKRFKIVSIISHSSPSPVEDYAKNLFEMKYTTAKKIDGQFLRKMRQLKPDVGILASFGKILPKKVLEVPKRGILNIHPSLLPKYRGPTPVPTAILNGDKITGVSIIKMDEKMDHGPIVAQFKEEIRPGETADELLERLFEAGAGVLKTILPAYLEGKIKLKKQNHSQATYTKLFNRDDGKINWKKPTNYLDRHIRAMDPWPGAWTEIKIKGNKKRLKVLKAHLEGSRLVFDQVQLEGKNPVTWKQFQEGYPGAKNSGHPFL